MSFLDKFKRTNKKQIKVSVIIPVYNTEQYLDKCLNSIEQQTLTDIEIICIDDCSTDSSLDILKDHARKDNRIIILQNEENKGAGYSRNIGLNIAQGKYIMFIDSDDYIDLETLEYCFKKSEEEEVEVLMFKARNWDIEEKKYVKNDMIELCPLEDYNNKIFNHDDIDSDLLFKISVTAQTKLFLRSYLEENEFRFPEDIIHEDNPFFIKMFLTAKRVYVMDKYFYHRILRSGSIITLKGLVILDIIDSLEITLRFLMNNSEFYNKYHESYYEYMMHTINNRLKIIKPEYLNNFFNYCKSFIQKCIVEYDLDSDIRKSLSKHFLHFYNLMVLSIKSDNEKVQNIQQELTLDMPVSIIIYCDNKTPTQINEIVHNLTYQDKIFAYMNLIFVSDTSISDETNQVIKEYEETLYNVNRIQLDSIDKLNNYKQIMDSITSQYVLFYDENMTYEDTFIKDIFRKSRVAQKNIEQDLEYEQKHDIKQLTSGSKLLKRKFLSKSDNVFIEENTSIINPFMFYKGNKPKHEKIMEILSEFIEEQTAIQKYNNIILDTLRISFYDTEVSVKNEYFTQIKKFIHQKIIKNDLNTLFREKMSKTNEMFYDLIILSLNSNTENIHKLQEKIRFNSPISIIIFCDNKTSAQINNIVHNLINQSMNFSYMNLVFITNTSISNETKKLVKEYKQTFYNMNTIELESIDKINSYRQILNNITSQYILFYDEKVTYDYSFIKNIFRKTRVAQKSIEQDLEYEQKYEIKPLTIGTKLLKRKFLLKKDNVFIETSTPLINPYMFYKGNKPKQDKVIEILNEFIEEESFIQKYNNIILDTLRVSFYDTEASVKNEYFTQIKKFIHQKIIKNDLNTIFREKMSKTNKMFYDLIILSIENNDEKIRKVQKNILRDNPISIVCYCNNNSKLELDRTLNSILKQSIGFLTLDVILVDDNSSKRETRNTIEEYTSTYTNIRSMYLNENYGEIKSYFEGLNSVNTRYVMFLNNNYHYLPQSIKELFKAIRLVNFPGGSGKVDKLTSADNNLIWTKIFQKQDIIDCNIEFVEENENIIIDLDKYPKLKTTFEDIPIIKKL